VRIAGIAEEMIGAYSTNGTITYPEFKVWLQNNPRVMETFTASFKSEVWQSASVLRKSSGVLTPRPVGGGKRGWGLCGGKRRQKIATEPLNYQTSNSNITINEGFIYKFNSINSIVKHYFVHKFNMLFIYNDIDDQMPSEVMFLEGCFVEKILDFKYSNKFGLRISYVSETFREIVLYLDTAEDRDRWVSALSGASKSRNVYNHYRMEEKKG
jgi:hypothetical protein